MAKGFGKRLANALAIGVGGLAEGYGKGSLEVAIRARDEYQQKMKDDRTAAMNQQNMALEIEEKEKNRQHDFALMEREQEYDIDSQKRTLDNQLTLEKMRIAGRGSGGKSGGSSASGDTAAIKEVKALAEKMYPDGYTNEQFMSLYDKYKGPRTSGGSGGRSASSTDTAAIKEVKVILDKMYPEGYTDEQFMEVYDRYKGPRSSGAGRDDTVASPKDVMTAIQKQREAMGDILNPEARAFSKLSPEEQEARILSNVARDFKAAGMSLPEGIKLPVQESEAEVKQPTIEHAPATSTQGDKPKDTTPSGQGTEASPFMALTPEQQQWVIDSAPSGAFVSDGKRVFRKP